MYPFFLISSLLFFFSFFTCAEVKHFIALTKKERLFADLQKKEMFVHAEREKATLQEKKAASHNPDELKIVKKKKKNPAPASKKKRCYKLNFDINRPPNNSRFNLYSLLFEEERKGVITKKEILENLLKTLYQEAPFFETIPNLEKVIVEKLFLEKETLRSCRTVEDFSTLAFENKETQEAFYLMLKGSDTLPSLLDFVTFDKKVTRETKKINLLFTSKEVLLSLFLNEKVAHEVYAMKQKILEAIRVPNTSFTRESLKSTLQAEFSQLLESELINPEDYRKYFDFGVGKPGSQLYLIDPITKKRVRETLLF